MKGASNFGTSDREEQSILARFDSLCVSFGERDTISLLPSNPSAEPIGLSYVELQEQSNNLAFQLRHRFRPDFVVVDCQGHAFSEAVAVLASIRLGVPFVPVHLAEGQLSEQISMINATTAYISAVVVVDSDDDPILDVLYAANIHQVLRLDAVGVAQGLLQVPESLPTSAPNLLNNSDALYILFTSGSTNKKKAVVGSHRSTFQRLAWFRESFEPLPSVARRSPLVFVDGVNELIGTLLEPESLLVSYEEPIRLQSEGVASLLRHSAQVTLLPSQLEQVLTLSNDDFYFQKLQRIIVSGEVCTENLFHQVQKRLLCLPQNIQFINLYGQTETTGDVLCALLNDLDQPVVDGVVAVGRPIFSSTKITIEYTNETSVETKTKRAKSDFGKIQLSGSNHSLGYLLPGFQVESLGTFSTGDMGFSRVSSTDNQEMWYIRGRTGDIHNINGKLTSLSQMETVLKRFHPSWSSVIAVVLNNVAYAAVVGTKCEFCRQRINASGISWNLIPQRVFYLEQLPTTHTGKVDRLRVAELVQESIQAEDCSVSSKHTGFGTSDTLTILKTRVSMLLHIPIDSIDESSSYPNLGGSSASAISLLYLLAKDAPAKVSRGKLGASDILNAESLDKLRLVLDTGDRSFLESRGKGSRPLYQPQPSLCNSSCHKSVKLIACVDAPVALGSTTANSLYIGCQGGVLVKVCGDTGSILASTEECGRIQSEVLVSQTGRVFAFAHGREGAHASSWDEDLQTCNWSCRMKGKGIKARPVWIQGGKSILAISDATDMVWLDGETGSIIKTAPLPTTIEAPPVCLAGGEIVYCSSSYDFGKLLVVTGDETSYRIVEIADAFLGPVYHRPLLLQSGKSFLIADSWGYVHLITQNSSATSFSTSSFKVSSSPLSAPAGSNSTGDMVAVGTLDGFLHGLSLIGDQLQMIWSINVGACIYSKPLCVVPDRVVVCTTAGDVVVAEETLTSGANIVWRMRIRGEIWSDPVSLPNGPIVFGARDSCVHFVDIESLSPRVQTVRLL